MADKIKALLDGKRIMILGFGREGQSTYRLLRSFFPNLMISIADRDTGLADRHPWLAGDPYVQLFTGDDYLDGCAETDMLIKSPGIPLGLLAGRCGTAIITSQTDLFLQACSERVTGVTGTKGKSTTTTLIHHILLCAGRKALLSGNIGIPPFDLAGGIGEDTEVVFEMSSHQLEHISLAPRTAILLNIFPEHLDHYSDFTAYKMAKFNIRLMQEKGGRLIYNADDPIIGDLLAMENQGGELLSFTLGNDREAMAYLEGEQICCRDMNGRLHRFSISLAGDLPGRHNIRNVMAAVLACLAKGVKPVDIEKGLATYKRLPHRLEFAGSFRGVSFYNDSIATIPEATLEALRTLNGADLLILGGFDRGLDYTVLLDGLKAVTVPHIVFMGPAGQRMHRLFAGPLEGTSHCVYAMDMEEVFAYARKVLKAGDTCLLSPAAASYGMFANFEERGEVFKNMAAGF